MRTHFRLVVFALMLGGSSGVVGQQPPSDNKKATFTMRINLGQNPVQPGAEVQVVVDLTNISDAPIHLVHAKATRAQYDVRAFDRKGKAVPWTEQERLFRGEAVVRDKSKPMRIRVGGGYAMTIAPGATVKDGIIIHDQVDLSEPGDYTIHLERIDPVTKVLVKSNTVTLTVAK